MKNITTSGIINNMNRRKILFVIDSLGAGGAERQLVYLLEGLDKTRFEPIVLLVHDEKRVPPHFKTDIEAQHIPIFNLNLPFPVGRVGFMLTAIQRYVRLMWQIRPDIVQGCLYVANVIIMVSRPFCPRHRLLTIEQQSYYGNGRLRVLRWLHWLSDRIITNSPRTYQTLIHRGRLPARKVLNINCGVKLEQFRHNPQPNLREHLFPGTGFVAANITRIDPEKNHITLLKALHLLKSRQELPDDFRLLIMGAVTSPETQAQIEQAIAEYHLTAYITRLPPTNQVAACYHLADVTILPSLYESFGLVLIEALTAGKPVIASDGANVLNAVQEGKTGWTFPAKDAEALADCLYQAMRTPPDALRMMGARGREEAAQYSVEKMVAAYTALYLEAQKTGA